MNTAQPIRTLDDLNHFKNYYRTTEYHPRNYLLLTFGLNTALRISDILKLRWNDVYNFSDTSFREHLYVTEQKTGKSSCIYLNSSITEGLILYYNFLESYSTIHKNDYLFAGTSGEPISRVQAYRIIKKAAEHCHLSGVISPHSLRKTFGYHAWKRGTSPVLLMNIYNHSSFTITQRYLGIEQEDRDDVFKSICL